MHNSINYKQIAIMDNGHAAKPPQYSITKGGSISVPPALSFINKSLRQIFLFLAYFFKRVGISVTIIISSCEKTVSFDFGITFVTAYEKLIAMAVVEYNIITMSA